MRHLNSLWAHIKDALPAGTLTARLDWRRRRGSSVRAILTRAVVVIGVPDVAPLGAARSSTWHNPSMRYARITVNPAQMGGTPCVRGLRIPVSTVVAMMADGMTNAEILAAYADLQAEDITEALRYASEAVLERGLPLDTVA